MKRNDHVIGDTPPKFHWTMNMAGRKDVNVGHFECPTKRGSTPDCWVSALVQKSHQQSMKPTENDPKNIQIAMETHESFHFLVVSYNPSFGGVFIPFLFPWDFWGSKGGNWSTFWTLKRHQAFQANGWRLRWLIHLRKWKNMGLFMGVMEDSLRYPLRLSAKQRSWQSSHWADHNDFLILLCCKYGFSGNWPYGSRNKYLDLRPIETMIMWGRASIYSTHQF